MQPHFHLAHFIIFEFMEKYIEFIWELCIYNFMCIYVYTCYKYVFKGNSIRHRMSVSVLRCINMNEYAEKEFQCGIKLHKINIGIWRKRFFDEKQGWAERTEQCYEKCDRPVELVLRM